VIEAARMQVLVTGGLGFTSQAVVAGLLRARDLRASMWWSPAPASCASTAAVVARPSI
jgi:hypothetical protein